MPNIDGNDFIAFKIESCLIESLRKREAFRDQSREAAAPVFNQLRSKCGLHGIHHLWRGKCTSLGEAIAQQFQAKEMVGVAMRNIDGRETPFRNGNPVGELRGLFVGEKCIDQQRVPLAANQRCRVGHPFQIVSARWRALSGARALAYE